MSNVVHPTHYNQGKIECIEAIKESMSHEAYLGFLKGNAMKYLWRYEGKNKPSEDLEKAKYYIDLLIGELGEKPVIDQFGKSVSEIYEEINRATCSSCMFFKRGVVYGDVWCENVRVYALSLQESTPACVGYIAKDSVDDGRFTE